jgi:hypothetical protein
MLEPIANAVNDVTTAFPDYDVTVKELEDGTFWVTLHGIGVGTGWNKPAVDLSVKLQPTFPDTEPYPFYCDAGLQRTDGRNFSPIAQIALDGAAVTQISLKKGRLMDGEDLGGRFLAVVRWLRVPR